MKASTFKKHFIKIFLSIPCLTFKMNVSLTNITDSLDDIQPSTDFFKDVYEDPVIKWGIILTYLMCGIGIYGLLVVVWFERSGMAGNFRTLVNQLVSFNLEQVNNIY